MKIAAGALLVGLGLGLGYLVSDRPARPAPVREAVAETPARTPVRVVHYAAPALPQTVAIDHDADEAPQHDRATQIVDDATARGVWTEADREALNEQLEPLSGPTKAEIVARVADAVNRGTLRITTDLPL